MIDYVYLKFRTREQTSDDKICLHFLAIVNPLNVAFWQAIRTANSLQTT